MRQDQHARQLDHTDRRSIAALDADANATHAELPGTWQIAVGPLHAGWTVLERDGVIVGHGLILLLAAGYGVPRRA